MTADPYAAGRPAAFLDRDGTIVREVDFLTDPEQLELLPGAARALRRLERAGYARVLITNQSGVARGYLSEARLHEVHRQLRRMLSEAGASLDAIYYCPHHPSAGEPPYRRACDCRKPAAGMLERATDALGLDPRRSFTVGDSLRDLQAAAPLGIEGVLVETGKGSAMLDRLREAGEALPPHAPDLEAAVERWLGARVQGK